MSDSTERDIVQKIKINVLKETENVKIVHSEELNFSDIAVAVVSQLNNPKDDVEMISDDDIFQDTETSGAGAIDDVDSNPFQDSTDTNKFFDKLLPTKNDKNNQINKKDIKSVPDKRETNEYYDMLNSKRGVAVILNHRLVKNHSERKGTTRDLECLEVSLGKLNFDVRSHTDLSKDDIRAVLETIAKEDHTDNDCLMVVVMSHGETNYIYATDEKYPSDFLWSPFLGNKCETLIGKPKMFFIQACRGDKVDDGVVMSRMQRTNQTETDSPDSEKPINFAIPSMADLLMMYSTFDGHFSFRSPEHGSWFIQVLCEEFNTHGDTLDLLTLLTGVNRRIAFERRSNIPGVTHLDAKKQMPCITSTLTKILYFTPKTYKKL